jgi:hypothetical protein
MGSQPTLIDEAVEDARAFLEQTRGHWRRMCSESDLNYHWVVRFAQGRIDNPTVGNIRALLQYRDRLIGRRPREDVA